MIKRYSLLIFLAVLFLSDYAFALAAAPPCPCDNESLENGISGNDLIELLCPGGKLGSGNTYKVEPGLVEVASSNPFSAYDVLEDGGGQTCIITTNDVLPVILQLTGEEYELCRIRVIAGCGLNERNINIPTLSEWGLIAMAGVLGIIGFMVIRRRKVTA